jgi:hypothetical protein
MDGMEPVNLEQKVETRFCFWDTQSKKLWWFDALWGDDYKNKNRILYDLCEYGSKKKYRIVTLVEKLILLPYHDNYLVEDGVLYQKSDNPAII